MRLQIDTGFEAAHKLMSGVARNSPCRRLHGHSYRVRVIIDSTRLDDGVIIDTDVVKDMIRSRFDHRYLNEVMSLNPTVENIVYEIHDMLRTRVPPPGYVYLVEVQEGFQGAVAQAGPGGVG